VAWAVCRRQLNGLWRLRGNRIDPAGNGFAELPSGEYSLVFGCTAGAATCPVSHLAPSLGRDPSGNVRLAWRVTGNGEGYTPGLYSSQLTTAGLTGTRVELSGQQPTVQESGLACSPTGCSHAWRDQRTQNFDIYTARTNAAGDAGHVPGIQLAIGLYAENTPDVAFDGTNYAVAYLMRDNALSEDHVYLARISPEGQILDAPPILVSSGRSASTPRISYGAGMYFVSWTILNQVHFARVSPAGVVQDPGGVIVSALPAGQRRLESDNGFDGTGFLLVYRELTVMTGVQALFAARVPTSGAAGPVIEVRPYGTPFFVGGIDCVGAGCLVAYSDSAAGAAVLVSDSDQVGPAVALGSSGVPVRPAVAASPAG
jgi:hypothetical protein